MKPTTPRAPRFRLPVAAGVTAVVGLALTLTPSAMQTKQIVNRERGLNLPFSAAVKAGGLIYLSGTLATDDAGQLVEGDVGAQTRRVLENLSRTLALAGSSLDMVASVTVYLRQASDFQAMNDVYRTFWQADPPARTTIQADLVLPKALVEISMVAIPTGGERKVVHPADWARSPNPYSYGILTGDTVFLAGLVARNGKDNSVVEGDITTQTRAVLDNGGAILAAAGMSHQDVVSSRVYLTDTAMFQEMNAAYRTYFPSAPPARATVRAALMGPQYSVEITMVAVKDPSRRAHATPAADGTPGRANPNLSSAIQVGNRLYLSGMLGNTDATKGDVGAQTRETLARLGRTMKAAGFDWPHLVDGVVYLTDVGTFADMNAPYREIIGKDFPARATVGTGLMGPDGLVEIMFTAVR
jgi:reactive intermediate/imine deaminase